MLYNFLRGNLDSQDLMISKKVSFDASPTRKYKAMVFFIIKNVVSF